MKVARAPPTHRTAQTQNKRTHTSMPQVGFEPKIPMVERAKTVHVLHRAGTAIGLNSFYSLLIVLAHIHTHNVNFKHSIFGNVRSCSSVGIRRIFGRMSLKLYRNKWPYILQDTLHSHRRANFKFNITVTLPAFGLLLFLWLKHFRSISDIVNSVCLLLIDIK
jgi:hypothetical protein